MTRHPCISGLLKFSALAAAVAFLCFSPGVALAAPPAGNGSPGDATAQAADEPSQGVGSRAWASLLAARLYAQVALEADELAKAYERDLERIGWYRLLNAERLRADPDLSRGRVIAVEAAALADQYRERSLAMLSRGEERIKELTGDEAAQKRLLAAFGRHEAEARADVAEGWRLEAKVLDAFAAVVDFLAETRGRWTIPEKTLTFARGEDLNRYRSLLDDANRATQAQDAFQSQIRSKAWQAFLEALK
ncbi:hypothetical protein dsat_0882 [Alkalidesulfovibrio alkalitolerans DSM 16529]|jgi:hypothetical protein|uniref:Uncharacterized protein n=1 Tax=Alkalidesulfovibrio alkalitolerans DSM 16529 TaxID=1121439 RepID=S7UH27_9BACT|nr:hypothetical protein [Alkalidesulfovibrio alkalitolerans]EPR31558.1 hypothetical protein dsat_0882 [Alkalidesulfovibrio alkalitolerans DSM 16529]